MYCVGSVKQECIVVMLIDCKILMRCGAIVALMLKSSRIVWKEEDLPILVQAISEGD